MDVTYFIGNGFDISMGLKTGYREFRTAYLYKRIPLPQPRTARVWWSVYCGKWLMRIKRQWNGINWSDMEAALGQLTRCYRDTPASRASFFALRDDIEDSLAAYLFQVSRMKEDDLIAPDRQAQIREAFDQALRHPLALVTTPHDLQALAKVNARLAQEPIHCHFINFNYTKVFDDCVDIYRNRRAYRQPGMPEVTAGPVFHPHGYADDGMIFGVSNYAQIGNKKLQDKAFADGMIKPRLCAANHNNAEQTVMGALRSSKLLVVAGMSVGGTDAYWWSLVGRWLWRSKENQLIIHYVRPGLAIQLACAVVAEREKIMGTLCNAFGNNCFVGVADQVHITFNQKLFRFRLIPEPKDGCLKRVWKRLRGA